jgi:hypothetical protein
MWPACNAPQPGMVVIRRHTPALSQWAGCTAVGAHYACCKPANEQLAVHKYLADPCCVGGVSH